MTAAQEASEKSKSPHGDSRETFFPRGAIASFVAMALLYAGLWFLLYFLMVQRS